MGVSTDAILFYGYCWDEKCRLLEDDDREWPEIVLCKRGVVSPWGGYPREEAAALDYQASQALGDRWVKENDAALNAWNEAGKAVQAEFDCDVGAHCSGECAMPYVFVVESAMLARRGYPEKIERAGKPNVGSSMPKWDGLLRRFVEELGIDTSAAKGPAWWLVSWWG